MKVSKKALKSLIKKIDFYIKKGKEIIEMSKQDVPGIYRGGNFTESEMRAEYPQWKYKTYLFLRDNDFKKEAESFSEIDSIPLLPNIIEFEDRDIKNVDEKIEKIRNLLFHKIKILEQLKDNLNLNKDFSIVKDTFISIFFDKLIIKIDKNRIEIILSEKYTSLIKTVYESGPIIAKDLGSILGISKSTVRKYKTFINKQFEEYDITLIRGDKDGYSISQNIKIK